MLTKRFTRVPCQIASCSVLFKHSDLHYKPSYPILLCGNFIAARCHSDLEQKSLCYNPDLEELLIWTIFEKTSSENGSESNRGCNSKMGEKKKIKCHILLHFYYIMCADLL